MGFIIEIENLTKKYINFSLNSITLNVPYGKIVGLVGENGAGKTTLINLLLNQISRDEGSIKVFGKDNLEAEKEIKSELGFVVDECCFHSCLSSKNINAILRSVYKNWDVKKYFNYLERFNIDIKKKISEMSKGMKSKMMLAAALSHNPQLLILDEITSGLDPVARDDVLHILREFASDEAKTVFFSTHITSDLDKIADYVAFIHNGELVLMDPIESLKDKYVYYVCSSAETKNVDPSLIIAHCIENDKHTFLLSKTVNSSAYGMPPTIDNIMLLYIKGRV